jgi:hypothetical protein
MIHYWHLLSFLAIAFGLTYLGERAREGEARDATNVAGSFPVQGLKKKEDH